MLLKYLYRIVKTPSIKFTSRSEVINLLKTYNPNESEYDYIVVSLDNLQHLISKLTLNKMEVYRYFWFSLGSLLKGFLKKEKIQREFIREVRNECPKLNTINKYISDLSWIDVDEAMHTRPMLCDMFIDAFDWDNTKRGKVYWKTMSKKWHEYVKDNM